MSVQAQDRVVRLADLHTRTVQAWLSSRSPNAISFEGVGVKVSSTGLLVPLLNLALGSDYPARTGDEVIADEIETVKAFFAGRNVPWYWWLGPHSHPPDMAQRLGRHGLVFDPPPLPAMVASLPAQSYSSKSEIKVWQAVSRKDLEAASTIRRIAFRFPNGTALDYFGAMADDWLRGDPARLYLASVGNSQPAAIGALIVGAGVPGIYVMATLPEWRRQGLGKAILARILCDATKDGHDLIVLTASQVGYQLYRQFGFEHIFDYAIYRPHSG